MKLEDLINGLQQLGLNHIAYIIAGITAVVFICIITFKFSGQPAYLKYILEKLN